MSNVYSLSSRLTSLVSCPVRLALPRLPSPVSRLPSCVSRGIERLIYCMKKAPTAKKWQNSGLFYLILVPGAGIEPATNSLGNYCFELGETEM